MLPKRQKTPLKETSRKRKFKLSQSKLEIIESNHGSIPQTIPFHCQKIIVLTQLDPDLKSELANGGRTSLQYHQNGFTTYTIQRRQTFYSLATHATTWDTERRKTRLISASESHFKQNPHHSGHITTESLL